VQLPGSAFFGVGAAASVENAIHTCQVCTQHVVHLVCRTGASVASLVLSVNDPLLPSRDIHRVSMPLNKRLYTYLVSKLGGAYFDVCIYSRLSSARCHSYIFESR